MKFPPNLHGYITGTVLRDNKMLVTLAIFSRLKGDFKKREVSR